MKMNVTLDELQHHALSAGYALSTPLPDMYGGYECCLENLRTGQINAVMNCRTPIEAAQAAIADIIRESRQVFTRAVEMI